MTCRSHQKLKRELQILVEVQKFKQRELSEADCAKMGKEPQIEQNITKTPTTRCQE